MQQLQSNNFIVSVDSGALIHLEAPWKPPGPKQLLSLFDVWQLVREKRHSLKHWVIQNREVHNCHSLWIWMKSRVKVGVRVEVGIGGVEGWKVGWVKSQMSHVFPLVSPPLPGLTERRELLPPALLSLRGLFFVSSFKRFICRGSCSLCSVSEHGGFVEEIISSSIFFGGCPQLFFYFSHLTLHQSPHVLHPHVIVLCNMNSVHTVIFYTRTIQ